MELSISPTTSEIERHSLDSDATITPLLSLMGEVVALEIRSPLEPAMLANRSEIRGGLFL